MPAFDPATQSKECSKCTTVFFGDDVPKNFFKVRAMKDGYATRCKKCYYVKDDAATVHARTDQAMERKFKKFVEAKPIKERANKPFSHTDQEIKRIEATAGLKFLAWEDMGDCMMPKFGKVAK